MIFIWSIETCIGFNGVDQLQKVTNIFLFLSVFGPVASLSTTSSSSSIDVSWSSPGDGGNAKKVSGYFITWSPPNSEGVISHNAAATATKYTIPNLDSNTDYDVKIYAKSDAGNGDKSDKTQSTGWSYLIKNLPNDNYDVMNIALVI